MNLAALWRLPVLFLCENNLYAMGTALALTESQVDLCAKARSYDMPADRVDGMDVTAVERAALAAVATVRAGDGPRFLELATYRFRAHSMFDAELYREKREVESWKLRDPIASLSTLMKLGGALDEAGLSALESEVAAELDAAVAFAEAGTLEPVDDLTRDVYATGRAMPGSDAVMVRTTWREAMRSALREALQADPRVFLMGEDVGRYGGCYAVSRGLLEEFGPERIRDTPLSESAFVGAGIGAALNGMRPIVEVMTVNFSLLALDQIVNNAATLRHMSGGQFAIPLVIRMATGAGRQLAAQHSHSLEGWYAHVPGLKVLCPATLEDARGMLASALADPNPVMIFEHVGLFTLSGELPDGPTPVDLDRAMVMRAGGDVTVVTHGAGVYTCLEAAESLADTVDLEVIDLRTLRPLDEVTVLESVGRTGRLVVVEEAWRSGGIGAELAARVAEHAFWDLDAPVERVATAEVPIPYAKHLETAALPSVEDVIEAVRRVTR
jgi:2-oxoisovalerate dehydrogenase E1 component